MTLSDAAELQVQQFYSNHATIVAGVQGVTQDGTAKKVLQRTTQKIHREFSTEVGSKISLRKFQSMRPGFVMLANSNKFNTSLCEYCVNFEEKIQAVSSQAARMGLSELSSLDKYDVINMTLCPRNSGDYHKLACLERKCDQCGPEKLNILVLGTQDKILNWKRWETEKFVTKSQDGAELNAEGESKKGENKCKEAKPSKTITKKVLHDVTGDNQQLVQQLMEEAKTFSMHLFNAKWQRQQLHLLKNHLPKKWLLCVEDYAENFRTQFQDEVQSAHYNYEQATLFCVVAYYKCHVCEEDVEESFVGITSDLTHDAHSVHAMKLAFSQHLKSKGLTFEHSVAFSDGCAAQFKSKLPFYYLMNSKKDLGYTSQRCFFGTRHVLLVLLVLQGHSKCQ